MLAATTHPSEGPPRVTHHPDGLGHVVQQVLAGLGAGLHGAVVLALVLLRVAFRLGLAKVAGTVVLLALLTRPVWRRVRARRAARMAR